MKTKHLPLIASIVIYILGAAIGFTLVLLSTWAGVEAQFYGFSRRANTPLTGFHCPIFLTPGETGKVSLRVSNPTSGPLSPNVRADISTPGMPALTTQSVKLAPGESKTLEWTIGPQNVDLGHFIFVEVLVYSTYPLPTREAICGINIINLPTNGRMIVAGMALLSLLGMGFGLVGLNRVPSPARRVLVAQRPLLVLSILITAAILVTFESWWGPGSILVVLILLLLMTTLGLILRTE